LSVTSSQLPVKANGSGWNGAGHKPRTTPIDQRLTTSG
jgi:hypothetical protein